MKRFFRRTYLTYLCKVDWLLFLKLNFFTKSIIRAKGAFLVPYRGTHVKLGSGSKIDLLAKLILNFSPLTGGESFLLLDAGAELKILNAFIVYYNCDIAVYENAVLSLGGGYMNSGSQLRCSNSITIGKDATIARDVMVLDSDSHQICDGDHVVDQPVIIGDHVWLGTRSLVLKGVQIGDGAIVAAGSLVIKDVASRTVVVGVPAKCVRQEVEWK